MKNACRQRGAGIFGKSLNIIKLEKTRINGYRQNKMATGENRWPFVYWMYMIRISQRVRVS